MSLTTSNVHFGNSFGFDPDQLFHKEKNFFSIIEEFEVAKIWRKQLGGVHSLMPYTRIFFFRLSIHDDYQHIGNKYKAKKTKHTTVRIRWWSPTQLLTHRRVA
jgi:hypothetical protein